MTTLATIGLMAAMILGAQEPGQAPGGWGRPPSKPPRLQDPDAEAALEKRLLEGLAAAERQGPDLLPMAEPLEQLATYLLSRKRWAEAEPLFRRALAIRERIQGPDHLDVADSLVGLSLCLIAAKSKAKGADEAGPMLRRALAIFEKAAKDGPDVARVLHAMALGHLARDEFDAAQSDLTRALAIREKTAGPDSDEAATILDDLGDLYAVRTSSSGRAEDIEAIEGDPAGQPKAEWPSERYARKAEGYYKRALAIREKLVDRDDDDVAETLFNLAQLAELRDRPADAVPYLKRWLALGERRRTRPSRALAHVHDMLGQAAVERKDWDEAEQHLALAQKTIETLEGAESKDVGAILSERTDVALQAGRFDDAEGFLRRRLDIEAAPFGRDDPDVVEARALMAGSYRDHVNDRRAPILWRRLTALSKRVGDSSRTKLDLAFLLRDYVGLLRRTNRVVLPPTRGDFEYLAGLKEAGSADFVEREPQFAIQWCQDQLDDQALAHVGRLYDLDDINLTGRAAGGDRVITDAGLAHLKNLINLRYLSLRGTEITDAGLAHLAGLENLVELNLGITRITDAGLVHLKRLSSLRTLWLSATNVSDAGLAQLEAMPNLERLFLNSTRVTEAGVERLRKARPGIDIDYRYGPGFRPLEGAAIEPTVPALPPSGKP